MRPNLHLNVYNFISAFLNIHRYCFENYYYDLRAASSSFYEFNTQFLPSFESPLEKTLESHEYIVSFNRNKRIEGWGTYFTKS